MACLRDPQTHERLRDGAGRLSADFCVRHSRRSVAASLQRRRRRGIAFMRILVAHQVPRARTGGMSRLMAFIHDRLESAGHEVDYFCSDDVPASWAGWWGRRVAFPMAIRARAINADRSGRPYDIVNVHEPSAAPLIIGRRAHQPRWSSPAMDSSGVRGTWLKKRAVSAVKRRAGAHESPTRRWRCGQGISRSSAPTMSSV